MSALERLPTAVAAYKKAEEALIATVRLAFPIGARVLATIGRARVRGPVIDHGGPGYYRGYIIITNEETGKRRRFYAADRSVHDVTVESLPADLRVREFPR